LARILLVEDDPALLRGLVAMLRAGGYAVDTASDGASAVSMATQDPYAVVMLDVGLPDFSGFEVLKRLRERGCRMPILMLTARDTVQDRVTGLDLGADDYILKPFEPTELEARIRALMRRSHGDPSPILTIGNLVIDRSLGTAHVGGRPLDLRRREWAVLDRLVARAGKLVSKEQLTDEVFGFDEPVAPNAIEVYVGRLRKKLEPDGPTIRTLRGLGYMLDASCALR
jgi:two-component system OmpR family response regulator